MKKEYSRDSPTISSKVQLDLMRSGHDAIEVHTIPEIPVVQTGEHGAHLRLCGLNRGALSHRGEAPQHGSDHPPDNRGLESAQSSGTLRHR